jgi:hypothetical protein
MLAILQNRGHLNWQAGKAFLAPWLSVKRLSRHLVQKSR